MKCPNCNNKLDIQPYLMFKCPNCHKTFKGDMNMKDETVTLTEVFAVPKEGYEFNKKKSSFFYYE